VPAFSISTIIHNILTIIKTKETQTLQLFMQFIVQGKAGTSLSRIQHLSGMKAPELKFQRINEVCNYSYFPVIFPSEATLLSVEKKLNAEMQKDPVSYHSCITPKQSTASLKK